MIARGMRSLVRGKIIAKKKSVLFYCNTKASLTIVSQLFECSLCKPVVRYDFCGPHCIAQSEIDKNCV